jgi:hypothetical protein
MFSMIRQVLERFLSSQQSVKKVFVRAGYKVIDPFVASTGTD